MKSMQIDGNKIRNIVVEDFEREYSKKPQLHSIAVVGGSLDDHEVRVVGKYFPNAKIEVFGIEKSQNYLDLNEENNIVSKFDLVLCTNVLEHVFHHENFAKNLISLLNPSGEIWCSFPFNDLYHGSPHYYSAGFHPEYLNKLFSRNGAKVKKSKLISSKRGYLFTHLLKDWPSEFRYDHPLAGQVIWALGLRGNPRPPLRNLSMRRLLVCVILSCTSKKISEDPNFGCTVWSIVCRK